MAWCRQATSHYMSQCWSRSMAPYGVTRPQWVKLALTHWVRVMHICVSKLSYLWFRQWLVAWKAPNHYFKQCWNIVHWSPKNTFQWNFNQDSYILIRENPFENARKLIIIFIGSNVFNVRFKGNLINTLRQCNMMNGIFKRCWLGLPSQHPSWLVINHVRC